MTEKVANPMNWLKLIGGAAARGAGGVGRQIGNAARSNPGVLFDIGAGSALTAADYTGFSPLAWGEDAAAAMSKAGPLERAVNLGLNIGSVNLARRGFRQNYNNLLTNQKLNLNDVAMPFASMMTLAGSGPALRTGANATKFFLSGSNTLDDIAAGLGTANDRVSQIFGGVKRLPDGTEVKIPSFVESIGHELTRGIYGDYIRDAANNVVLDARGNPTFSPGILPRLESRLDMRKAVGDVGAGASEMLSSARPYLATGLGAGAGGLLGNLFTEPLTDKDSKQESERKQYRNRLLRLLGAAFGGGTGYLAHHLTKTSGAEVTDWGSIKSHAVASALRSLLGAGIGAGVNQIHEAFVPTTNSREKRLKSRLALIGGAGAGLGGGISEAVRDYMNTGFKTVQASETAPGAGYGGYQGLSLQANMPISQRRLLTAAERKDVDAGQSKWLRGPFASEGDSISARMASPFKRSLLAALATTAAGAGLGAYASSSSGGNPFDGALAGGGLGALGGIPMGILAYLEQQKLNKTLEERMRRLPEGQTTIRDMMSDPVTGYGERMQSFQDQMNPSFSGSQLAQLATLAARMPRR